MACASGDDGLDPSFAEPAPQSIRIVCLVGDQAAGWSHDFQHGLGHGDIGDVARRQGDGDDAAASIGQTMDFRCSAAARDADRVRPYPPFPPAAERCAFTWELSSISSSEIEPLAAILAKMRCQTPRRAQRAYRL